MMRQKMYASFAGMAATAVLMTGCSSGQKPASLGTGSGGTGTAAAGGGTGAASGTSPADGATSSATSVGGVGGTSTAVTAGGANGGTATAGTTAPGTGGITGTAPTDANAAAALAAFKQFETIRIRMISNVKLEPIFNTYADSEALSATVDFITQSHGNNTHMVGTPTYSEAVTALDITAKPLPTAKITECFDQSKFHNVVASGPKKGQPGILNEPTRPYVVYVVMHKASDGKWRATSTDAHEDQTC